MSVASISQHNNSSLLNTPSMLAKASSLSGASASATLNDANRLRQQDISDSDSSGGPSYAVQKLEKPLAGVQKKLSELAKAETPQSADQTKDNEKTQKAKATEQTVKTEQSGASEQAQSSNLTQANEITPALDSNVGTQLDVVA